MYPYSSSPTPKPKRHSSARPDASESSYTLPPGPYSREKPSWSLAALIGQAITASYSGALPLNDIYTYISTVYPHYNRRDQPWMSSVRHSLSVNEAFERVPDQDGGNTRRRGKGMTRLKGGLWRIKPGHEPCFEGGNFVRKGAKGAGPGKNLGGRKRAREDEGDRKDKKRKVNEASPGPASTSSQPLLQNAPSSSRHSSSPAIRGEGTSLAPFVPTPSTTPVLMTPQGTVAPELLLSSHYPSSPSFAKKPFSGPGMSSPGSPDLPLALTLARPSSRTSQQASYLEPGFELEMRRNSDQVSYYMPLFDSLI
jgi:Forkhead domain